MTTALRTFLYALILTGLTASISGAIAAWGFQNLYYLAQLLPLFMALYLLLGWLLYLKRDSFLASDQTTPRAKPTFGHHENELTKDLPESKVAGEELLVKGDRIIARRDTPKQVGPDRFQENSIFTLLWSSGQLAVLAFILYRYFGVGTKFFLR